MIIYCMRHAQAEHNLKELMNGDPSKPIHLTDLGIKQAKYAAKKLHKIPFDVIYVSEFPRTHETAVILNNPRNIPIKVDKRINDIRSGMEGKTNLLYKRKRDSLSKKQKIDILKIRVKTGESFEDEVKRVSVFLKSLKKKPYKKVLVITHYDILQAINGLVNNLSLEEMKHLKPKNCEIFRFKI